MGKISSPAGATDTAEIEACRQLAETWAPVLRALGNAERLLIVLWLANSECSVRELERVTGMKQSLVSYHLRELRSTGLVSASPSGRTNRYRLAESELDEVATLIGTISPNES